MGYRGQTGIYEILIVNDAMRRTLAGSQDVAVIRKTAVEGGMETLLMNGLKNAAEGITSIEEVLRVVPHELNA